MTFTEIQNRIAEKLDIPSTATASIARIGREINDLYREVTSAIGIDLSRRDVGVVGTTVEGVQTVTFDGIEKIERLIDDTSGSVRILTEVSFDQIRSINPALSDSVRRWAVQSWTGTTVTVRLDIVPQSVFDLKADGYVTIATLSGSDVPAFPASFHDILVDGVLIEEYLKQEKPALSDRAAARYEKRLSDLRLWRATTINQIFRQAETRQSALGSGGASGGGGGGFSSGGTSWTQTGLITFDRDPAAPFAVSASSAVVANLDADKLDGQDGSYYLAVSNFTGVTTARLLGRTTAGTGAVEHISVDASLALAAGSLGRAALTGDITASAGSNTTALRNSSACSVIGRSANSTGAPADIAASTNNTLLVRISNALSWVGGIVFGSGNKIDQIAFNPTQNASSDVNTLDDYEEGTWTPLIGGTGGESGQSYTNQTGTYIKIGKLVVLQFIVTLSAKGTITGNLLIGNFPFTVSTGYFTALMWDATVSNFSTVLALPNPATAGALLRAATAVGTSSNSTLATADIGNTTTFSGTIIYHATA